MTEKYNIHCRADLLKALGRVGKYVYLRYRVRSCQTSKSDDVAYVTS